MQARAGFVDDLVEPDLGVEEGFLASNVENYEGRDGAGYSTRDSSSE